VKTRENVDLWLHGFALLQQDTTLVPFFRRGYRDDMTVRKNQANVLTQLDVNADRLRQGLRQSPALINAQFVPFYFTSLAEMRSAIDLFIAVQGNPQGARNAQEAAELTMLSGYFRDPPSRAWLSLFASSLWDEDAKYYHSYWLQQQRERANVIDSVTAMWQHTVRPAFQRVLNNTQQRDGDIILSLPLDGEGRTLSGGGLARNVIGVTFPSRPSSAPDAIYVIAHEVMGTIAATAITDNTTPAQQRAGVADELQSAASVRGGLLLIQQTVPSLADGYARYYISATGRTPGANPRAQLTSLFPLPAAINDAMARELTSVLTGI